MNSSAEIKQLAKDRLEDAKILLINKRNDGAFYLAGYAVELVLKAKVCEHLDIDDLFSDNPTSHSKGGSLGKFREAVKTHDFTLLFNLCGLGKKLNEEKSINMDFYKNYSSLENWNESARYKRGKKENEVIKIIDFLTEPTKGLLQWIENN
jgi:hypothetical protein